MFYLLLILQPVIAMLNVKHENTVTDMLLELLKREKENRTIPDEDLDIFIKVRSFLLCGCSL